MSQTRQCLCNLSGSRSHVPKPDGLVNATREQIAIITRENEPVDTLVEKLQNVGFAFENLANTDAGLNLLRALHPRIRSQSFLRQPYRQVTYRD